MFMKKNFKYYTYRSPLVIVLLASAVSASRYSAYSGPIPLAPASARVLTEDLSVSVPVPTSAVFFGPPRRAGKLKGLYALFLLLKYFIENIKNKIDHKNNTEY